MSDLKIFEVVKKLELELLLSPSRYSRARLDELLADDFFEFMQDGNPTNKKWIIDYLVNSDVEDFKVRDINFKILSPNNILLHYIMDREVLTSGEQKTTLCSSIWQFRNDRWQMIFFQGTPGA